MSLPKEQHFPVIGTVYAALAAGLLFFPAFELHAADAVLDIVDGDLKSAGEKAVPSQPALLAAELNGIFSGIAEKYPELNVRITPESSKKAAETAIRAAIKDILPLDEDPYISSILNAPDDAVEAFLRPDALPSVLKKPDGRIIVAWHSQCKELPPYYPPLMTGGDKRILYIRVDAPGTWGFMNEKNAYSFVNRARISGMILDLRSAEGSADFNGFAKDVDAFCSPPGKGGRIPLIVLIGEHTAGGAEIIAKKLSCMHGTLIGTPTAGHPFDVAVYSLGGRLWRVPVPPAGVPEKMEYAPVMPKLKTPRSPQAIYENLKNAPESVPEQDAALSRAVELLTALEHLRK